MTLRFAAAVLPLALACMASAQMSNFQSLNAAEDAARRIMDVAGLRTVDFEIVEDEGSNNAAAGMIRVGQNPSAAPPTAESSPMTRCSYRTSRTRPVSGDRSV